MRACVLIRCGKGKVVLCCRARFLYRLQAWAQKPVQSQVEKTCMVRGPGSVQRRIVYVRHVAELIRILILCCSGSCRYFCNVRTLALA